jgi:ABC-type transporter Mla subunit MlaD
MPREGAKDIMSAYNAAQPGLQATQGQINTTLGNLGTAGQGLAAQTGAFGQTAGQANGY